MCLPALLGLYCFALAQANSKISGTITDDKGLPVPGASIVIKGSKNGTVSGSDGGFSLSAKPDAVLVISAVGFITQEVAAKETALVITLVADTKSLSEVVVTALGFTREKKALGYAVSTVASKDLQLRPEGDLARVLNGKVPGMEVLNSSGISGSGTNISIRGISTITGGAATPLFIVDGVPFDGGNNTDNNFQYGGGTSTSSRFLDLDPNNIESVTVLKGLSATTLYGEAARNGVVLVTTKNGSSKKSARKSEVTVSQSLFANKIANLPNYQNEYGGGFDLVPSAAFSNWGAKFTDPPAQLAYSPSQIAAYPELFAGKTQDYKAYDNVRPFFRTGLVSTTSINISGSSEKVSFNGNYSYLGDQGFTPNNRVYKNNFGLGGSARLSNKLTLNAVLNFAITDFQTPAVGANSGGGGPDVTSVFGYLLFTPRSINLMGLPYENPITHESIYYRGGNDIENPRWTVNNSRNTDKTYRSYGSIGLKYDIYPGFTVNYRFGVDVYSQQTSLQVNKGGKAGGVGYVNGVFRTTNVFNSILNHTLNFNYTGDLTPDFDLTVDAGFDLREDRYNQDGMKSTQQLVYGLFNHSNFISHDIYSEGGGLLNYKGEKIRAGAYAQAQLGFREFLYMTLSGRNDWISTLEKDNRRLFYPGVSASFVPTSAIEALKSSKTINYLKVRLGYSTSAHFPDPYNTRPSLAITTNSFVDATGNVVNTAAIPNRLPNPNLKPELIKEVEAGIEGKFFNSRLSVDLTGYFRTANNQILERQLDPSTGSTSTFVNAGAVDNKGIEANIGVTVISSADWQWDLNGIFTLNRSKVHDLPSDIKQIQTGGYSNLGTFAIEGQPLGIIQGTFIQVDSSKGNKYIVDNNGYYLSSADIGIIADPNPSYKLTGVSTLSWKGFSFRMQWDYTHGGRMWSNTVRTLLARGLTADVGTDRKTPLILPNAVKQDGTPNDIQQSVNNIYFNNLGFGPSSSAIWDATLVRLRELSLSYSLPKRFLDKTPFGSVSLTFSGTNLFYYAPNFPKNARFDPESNSLGVSNAKGLDFFAGPSSRRFGGSIRVTF